MEIDKIVAELRRTFDSGKTRPIAWRKEQLRNLYHLIVVGLTQKKKKKELTMPTLRADLDFC